jgi:hypothetical protein
MKKTQEETNPEFIKFKPDLTKKVVDSQSQISAVEQLRKLSQEHLSIRQYTNHFGDLTQHIGKANIPDWLAIQLYSTGLNNEIRKEI